MYHGMNLSFISKNLNTVYNLSVSQISVNAIK